MNKRLCKTALLWAALLLWTALLFGFSGQSGEESAGMSEMLTRFVLRMLPGLPCTFDRLHFLLRKLAHFSIFAVEGMLLYGALGCSLKPRIAASIALPACGVIAALNEYHQSFIDGRAASVMDVGIDFAGAACGVALLWCIGRFLRRRNAKGS